MRDVVATAGGGGVEDPGGPGAWRCTVGPTISPRFRVRERVQRPRIGRGWHLGDERPGQLGIGEGVAIQVPDPLDPGRSERVDEVGRRSPGAADRGTLHAPVLEALRDRLDRHHPERDVLGDVARHAAHGGKQVCHAVAAALDRGLGPPLRADLRIPGERAQASLQVLVRHAILPPFIVHRQFKDYRDTGEAHRITWSEHGYSVRSATVQSNISWDHYWRWRENGRVLLLYVSSRQYQLVPKLRLPPGAVEEMRGYLGKAGVKRSALFLS